MTSRRRHAHTSFRPLVVAVAVSALAFGLGACSDSSDEAAAVPSSSAGSDPGATCGVHKVGDVQVRTFCGAGTTNVKSGTTKVTVPKAECETSADYLAVNAGTLVLSSGAEATKVKAASQYVGLTVGRLPEDAASTPAPTDGTYTGGILSVNDKGTALLPDPKTLKVTLTENRTAGSFTGALLSGGTVSGSFSCA